MKNKLLINVSPIRKPLTGIGYYTLNVLLELLGRDLDVIGIHHGKFISREELVDLARSSSSSSSEPLPLHSVKRFVIELLRAIPGIYQFKNKLLAMRSKNKLKKMAEEGYVYFEPSFLPFDYSGTTITTVHDLSFLSHPKFHPSKRVAYLSAKMQGSIDKSDHIVVDSDFILNELHKFFPSSETKSSTVYLGVDDGFKPYPKAGCERLLSSLNLQHGRFILSVATLEPRKNLSKLIDAYKLLPESVRHLYPLALVGDKGWKNSALLENASELVKCNQIIFTGYIADDELKRLYASATVFVYPSLYEGFGLPVIEAMASGIPVITSNLGATAEVAGNAAILVDPYNVDEISKNIERVLSDKQLLEALTSSALIHVQRYNWKTTAGQILKIASDLSETSR